MKAWNCSWPIFFTFLTVSTATGPAITVVSMTTRSMLSSSNGLPSSSITLTRARTYLTKESAHLVFDHGDVCPLASPNVGGHLDTLLSPWHLLARQSSNAVGHLDCRRGRLPHHLLLQGIVLFVSLIDRDTREHVLRLPYSEVASVNLPGYTWVLHWECYNVPQVNRDPPGIVRVVKGMEPWGQFRQGSISSSSTVAQY